MSTENKFFHICDQHMIEKTPYKKSISQSEFTKEQIDIIWDFYVTRSLSGGSGLQRSLSDYGWVENRSGNNGYEALENEMMKKGQKSSFNFIKGKNIKTPLTNKKLYVENICAAHPRCILTLDCKIDADINEKAVFTNVETQYKSIFRHIRNALAHGNTYFFANQNVLLEDKNKNQITAEILIPKQALLDWIKVVDKNQKFYYIDEADGVEKNDKIDF